ncbi:MAG: protein rep [Dictyoglomus sp.]|nr:protein rep [Dictyoglomus sp.]MDW8189307.1 hypothetical protein [Dictyoglomus sp.]
MYQLDIQATSQTKKRERAEKRVKSRCNCGKEGIIGLYQLEEEERIKYHPISCGSVLCEYCAWRESRKLFRRVEEYVKGIKDVLVFATLTIGGRESVKEAVKRAYEVKKRFGDLRVSGRKRYPKLREKVEELLSRYIERVRETDGEEEARKRYEFHTNVMRKFEKRFGNKLYESGMKVRDIFKGIWKFEITTNSNHCSNHWHSHWHIILSGYIPLFLLQALWIEAGGGEILDIRQVKEKREAIDELSKYHVKPVIKEEQLQKLSEETLIELEESLYGRRKVETWGIEKVEIEKESQWKLVKLFTNIRVKLSVNNIRDIPKRVRELWKNDIDDFEYCIAKNEKYEIEGKIVLDKHGNLWWNIDLDKLKWINRLLF